MGQARKALTLIEVLVVLTIIGVLAAILLPVLGSVRRKGLEISCLSHVKQLGQAFKLYLCDYDGWYPEAGEFLYASSAGWVYCPQEWEVFTELGSLFTYVRHKSVYRCLDLGTRSYSSASSSYSSFASSYSMNSVWSLAFEGSCEFPSFSPLLIEEGARSLGGRGPNDGVIYLDRPQDVTNSSHFGRGVIGWLDGRASSRVGSSLGLVW